MAIAVRASSSRRARAFEDRRARRPGPRAARAASHWRRGSGDRERDGRAGSASSRASWSCALRDLAQKGQIGFELMAGCQRCEAHGTDGRTGIAVREGGRTVACRVRQCRPVRIRQRSRSSFITTTSRTARVTGDGAAGAGPVETHSAGLAPPRLCRRPSCRVRRSRPCGPRREARGGDAGTPSRR